MFKTIFFSILTSLSFCFGDLSDYFKKDTSPKKAEKQIKNIDCIYLINLDQRPEKLAKSLSELAKYSIVPHRFSAVEGWSLSFNDLKNLGVLFNQKMLKNQWVSDGTNDLKREFLSKDSYGKTIFAHGITLGALGCTLSHLSILQDAYDLGYETIWVMEDDIAVKRDPKELSKLIERLDSLVGKDNWDVLYTDSDKKDTYFEKIAVPLFVENNDFESDLKGDLDFFWRPDIDLSDKKAFAQRQVISNDFVQIGSRARTHSMIIRRSGMKKILDFEKKHHIFLPYDHEIAVVPGIKLFNLRQDLVTFCESPSDTEKQPSSYKDLWAEHKKQILSQIEKIPGWQSNTKAEKFLNFLERKKPTTCIEIGAFAGYTTYQIAGVLEFLKKGTLYAIDSWDHTSATTGLSGKNILQWWNNIDLEKLKNICHSLFSNTALSSYCHLIHQKAETSISKFTDESIDLLYIDGNDLEKWNLEIAQLYLPKVKDGGFICLNRALLPSKNATVAFLLENATLLKDDSIDDLLIFQKQIRKNSLTTEKRKLKFFNLDLHISVIADVKNIFEDLGHEVVSWSISGHSWVFGKNRDIVDVVNEKTWESLDQKMCDEFYERYKDYLSQFDGFIVTHNSSFALLYEKFNKPIIIVNSTRYENPFTLDSAKWSWLNNYLREGVEKGKIFIVSNNKGDQQYLKYYTGLDSIHIPSLCLYTKAQYSGTKPGCIAHSLGGAFYTEVLDRLKNKELLQNKNCSFPHTWQELYSFSSIVHFPYQISTMSLFEQYSANVPLFFPSKKFLKILKDIYPNSILSQLSFFSVRNSAVPNLIGDPNNTSDPSVLNRWIELADYYDEENFPFIQYFDSFEDLEYKLEHTDKKKISQQMKEYNQIRKEKAFKAWKDILNKITSTI